MSKETELIIRQNKNDLETSVDKLLQELKVHIMEKVCNTDAPLAFDRLEIVNDSDVDLGLKIRCVDSKMIIGIVDYDKYPPQGEEPMPKGKGVSIVRKVYIQ